MGRQVYLIAALVAGLGACDQATKPAASEIYARPKAAPIRSFGVDRADALMKIAYDVPSLAAVKATDDDPDSQGRICSELVTTRVTYQACSPRGTVLVDQIVVSFSNSDYGSDLKEAINAIFDIAAPGSEILPYAQTYAAQTFATGQKGNLPLPKGDLSIDGVSGVVTASVEPAAE